MTPRYIETRSSIFVSLSENLPGLACAQLSISVNITASFSLSLALLCAKVNYPWMTMMSNSGLAFTLPTRIAWRTIFLLLTLTMTPQCHTISRLCMMLHKLFSLMPSFAVKVIAGTSQRLILTLMRRRFQHDAETHLLITLVM